MPEQPRRVFTSNSITQRRFPALRTLTAEDVEVMVMPPKIPSPPKKEEGARLLDPNLVKPGLNDAADVDPNAPKPKKPAASSSKPMKDRPPFRPCNPTEAKGMITDVAHGYVGIHSPYDLAHKLEMIERAEANKHIIGGIYCPNAWSQARKQIEVNYFLNSPDAETIEAERRYIQEKAQRNMVEYYRRLRPTGGGA